jgi:hypothetical protein
MGDGGLAGRNVEQEDGEPVVTVELVAERYFIGRNRRLLHDRQRDEPEQQRRCEQVHHVRGV